MRHRLRQAPPRGVTRLPLAILALILAASSGHATLPDYGELDAVLLRNVRNGFVDYDGIKADPAFGRFVTSLGNTEPTDLEDQNARLAYLINAYNALAIRGILEGYSPSSMLGRSTYFKRREYRILGQEMTLDELEHEQIAPLGDPRIHFAIVCASISCPRLSNRAYLPHTLDVQLDAAARTFANDGTRNRYDVNYRIAFLSKIFDWYNPDYERDSGSVQKYLAKYVSDPKAAELLARDGFELRFVHYDWDLNGIYTR